MIGTLEGVLTPIADAFLNYDSLKNVSKRSIMLVLCILHFSIGVLFTTGAGTYWLDIFNDYSANINLLTVGCLQEMFQILIIHLHI
jgi:solute carrier family 6 amino acid/orphan transporter-like 15/16/17/18/20